MDLNYLIKDITKSKEDKVKEGVNTLKEKIELMEKRDRRNNINIGRANWLEKEDKKAQVKKCLEGEIKGIRKMKSTF